MWVFYFRSLWICTCYDITSISCRSNKFHFEGSDSLLPPPLLTQRLCPYLLKGPQRTDNTAELDSRLRLDQTVDDSATQITRLRFEGKDPKQGFQVNVEDTSQGKSPGGEGGAGGGAGAGGGGGEDETKVEGAGSRKGALSPTRLSETSSSRRSSRFVCFLTHSLP